MEAPQSPLVFKRPSESVGRTGNLMGIRSNFNSSPLADRKRGNILKAESDSSSFFDEEDPPVRSRQYKYGRNGLLENRRSDIPNVAARKLSSTEGSSISVTESVKRDVFRARNSTALPVSQIPFVDETVDVKELLKLLQAKDEALQAEKQNSLKYMREVNMLNSHSKELEESLSALTGQSEQNAIQYATQAVKTAESKSNVVMEDALRRHGISILGFAGRHIEDRELQMEQLEYEILKRDKMVAGLKNQLREKEDEVDLVRKENESLTEYKINKDLEGRTSKTLEHSHAHAKIALNTAQLESLRYRNEGLERRFAEMEELLRQKDTELRALQQQLREREEELGKHQKEFLSIKFEHNIKHTNILELEKQLTNMDHSYVSRLRECEAEHQQQLKSMAENMDLTMARMAEQISVKERVIQTLEKKIQSSLEQYQKVVWEQTAERDELRTRVVELEASEAVNNQTAELTKMKRKIDLLKAKLEAADCHFKALQQDSALLQRVRSENSILSIEVSRLRATLRRSGLSTEEHCREAIYDSRLSPSPSNLYVAQHHEVKNKEVFLEPDLTNKSPDEKSHLQANSSGWANLQKWKLESSTEKYK